MKKDNTTIKRILRQTDNTNLKGYFQNDEQIVISNGYSVILTDTINNADFIQDLDCLNNAGHYDFKLFADYIKTNEETRNELGCQTIEILTSDLKMWKKHAEKGKPFIIPTKKGLMGVNPSYLLDLASLTRQDKDNTLIKIKVIDKKAPLYIDGNGVKALLCPVMVTDCTEKTYDNFKTKLADCYDLEKNTQELKAIKKANKPERNKKIKVSNMPIIVKNGVVCKDGYIYSDRNVDFLIYKNDDNKTYTLYHLNSMLPCFTDCKSIAAAIELIYYKLGEKSFIEKVIDIMQGNGAQERYNILIKVFGCLESATHFIDKLIDFKPTPAPTNDNDNTETKEETPKTVTIQDNAADIVADPETTETKTSDIVKADTVKADNCTDTDKAATTDTANNDSVTATQDIKTSDTTQDATNNAITSETMQADARQTETTQDTPHKASNKSVSLFIVTDKPQPVKLPTLKQLGRIPMYVERFKTDFKPLKNNKGYNTRVSNKKVLKKAYNDFVGTVSCYNDKCAIGGKVAAGNTS